MLPFVGVDGEGGDIATGDFVHHQFTMLRAGDRYVIGPAPAEHWLDFILTWPKRHIYVSYFFDYDVTMMLRDLPEERLRALVAGEEVYHGPYRLAYRPRKELMVRGRGRRVVVNDTGTFFQTTFVNALEQWSVGSVDERAAIARTKGQRQHFGALTQETIDYNHKECLYLAELMTRFRRTCETIGYIPQRWQGPGQLAKAMFRVHGIPTTETLPDPPPGVWEAAQAAYIGGRFETSAVGPVRGPVEGWDLSGAYPHACTQLPCLMHSTWQPSTTIEAMGLYKCSFTHRREQLWYGLPMRMPDGSIRWPRHGNGWFWGVELLAAQRLGAQLSVHSGWTIVETCECRWFDFMWRLYSIRKGLGKTEAGYTIKLGMNSAYGVCAQSVGSAPYANPVWAGLITAITRARINEALALDPHNVYMVATDGIFTAARFQLVAGEGLGNWERTDHPEGMFIVQPGVYFVGDKAESAKTRGIPQTALTRNRDALVAAWAGQPTDGFTVTGWTADDGVWQPFRQFVGLRLGLARGTVGDLGEWLPAHKRIGYDWGTKRRPNLLRNDSSGARTLPYDGDAAAWSAPYKKSIGGNDLRVRARLEGADTPDWADALTAHL